MKQRILSALIAIPLFAWVMLGAPLAVFVGAWGLLLSIAAYEWGKLISPKRSIQTAFVCVAVSLLWGILLSWQLLDRFLLSVVGIACMAWLLLVPFLLARYARTGRIVGGVPLMFALGILFLSAFAAVLMVLEFVVGSAFILALLVLIWANDAGAYFIGKAIGKTPFSPAISPNKTREGFFGGLAVALLLAAGMYIYYNRGGDFHAGFFLYWLLASLIALVYANLGDLFESMLKRQAGVKDSGTLLPGHGGAYDRIDSWLPAITLWFWLLFIMFVLTL